MPQPKVCILGNGLSAAFAVQSCLDHGIKPNIFAPSAGVGPTPTGAVWIHFLPASLAGQLRKQKIVATTLGDPDIYYRNMWGMAYTPADPVQPKREYWGWDPAELLDKVLSPIARTGGIFPHTFRNDTEIVALAKEYDLMVQTFPTFESMERNKVYLKPLYIWSSPDLEHGPSVNWLTYRGLALGDPLLRSSRMFGVDAMEFASDPPRSRLPPQGRIMVIGKLSPVCRPDRQTPASNIVLTGRLATWDPLHMSHQAYWDTKEALTVIGAGRL